MAHRIEVRYIKDPRIKSRTQRLRSLGFQISEVKLVEVYTLSRDFSKNDLRKIAEQLTNPVIQKFMIDKPTKDKFDFVIEIGFLPGVTDNAGNAARQTVEDFFKIKFNEGEAVHTSQMFLFNGDLSKEEIQKLAETLANPLIQRIHIKTREQYGENGMDVIVPAVKLNELPTVEHVNLDIDDTQLAILGKQGILDEKTKQRRGPLALDIEYLKAIRTYFDKKGRKPTDIELESLAQTWSEHCKHTIFAASMDNDLPEGLYKTYIRDATDKIRKKKGKNDACVSVFTDNSGAVMFDEKNIVTYKVETHNSPSALDPFGGAITGIVGVNRDTIGFGLGAKPCINYYGYCFADPETHPEIYRGKNKDRPILPPRHIMDGVVRGVNVGGNCSGIPTPQGWCYFNARYAGKPLVFVGTVGVMPLEHNGKKLYEKNAMPGDRIVVIGGRVGKDGVHGATFSSEALSSGSPATAVQIGDPFTQKKLSDAIVHEARDLGLYNSITDNGAGGISCSVSEMAKESNGCTVRLDKVPLKYPGMAPWEIWISESQERMTLAVPKHKLDQFLDLMQRREVEATVIGEFNDSGKCVVEYNGKVIMDIELDFLHDGLPEKHLKTTYTQKTNPEPEAGCPESLDNTMLVMLSRKNICSKEFISIQYDHAVQGGQVIGPLQGKGRVQGISSLTKVVLDSKRAVGLSQGVYPSYSDIDTYHMASAAIDTAIRGLVSIGIPVENIYLLDNFCWCSSNEPERLGQLKRAAKACHDYATEFMTPFISGKDSMFNDFKGFDKDGNPVKISVPPTLLVSSIGICKDVRKSVSMDCKFAGDLVYAIGETHEELGGSEYFSYLGFIGNSVPKTDAAKFRKVYEKLFECMQQELVASAYAVNYGGLGIALAKVSIAGSLGMNLVIPSGMRPDHYLFSESQGRFVITINPANKKRFEEAMGSDALLLGKITKSGFKVKLSGAKNKIINLRLPEMEKSYKSVFKGY